MCPRLADKNHLVVSCFPLKHGLSTWHSSFTALLHIKCSTIPHSGFLFWGSDLRKLTKPLYQTTRRYSRHFLESGITAVQCYDCPTAPCGSGYDTQVGRAKSDTRRCSGKCHTRRHPKVLLEHIKYKFPVWDSPWLSVERRYCPMPFPIAHCKQSAVFLVLLVPLGLCGPPPEWVQQQRWNQHWPEGFRPVASTLNVWVYTFLLLVMLVEGGGDQWSVLID